MYTAQKLDNTRTIIVIVIITIIVIYTRNAPLGHTAETTEHTTTQFDETTRHTARACSAPCLAVHC